MAMQAEMLVSAKSYEESLSTPSNENSSVNTFCNLSLLLLAVEAYARSQVHYQHCAINSTFWHEAPR